MSTFKTTAMKEAEQELPMAIRAEEHPGVPAEALQIQNAAGGVTPEKFAKVMMTPLTVIASTSLQGLTGSINSDSPRGLCFSLFMCGLLSTSGMIVCLRLVMEANELSKSEAERLKKMVFTYLNIGIGIMVSTLFSNMLHIVYDVSKLASSLASLAAGLVLVWSYYGFGLPKRLLQLRIFKWIWRPIILLCVLGLVGNSVLQKEVKHKLLKEAQAMGPSARI